MVFDRLEDLKIDRELKEPKVNQRKTLFWGISIGTVVIVFIVCIISLLFITFLKPKPQTKIEAPVITKYEQPQRTFAAGGYIEAKTQIVVSSKVEGQIKKFLVKEGDKVEKGQIICYLKDDEYQTQVNKAQASYNYAKAKLNYVTRDLSRGKQLQREGVISKKEREDLEIAYEAAIKEVKQALADLKEAEARHTYTTITSPLSGTIIKQHVEIGEMVFPLGGEGSGIVTIGDLSEILTKVEINETDITKLKKGQNVSIMPDALPGSSYQGEVIEIAPMINRQKGIVEIKIKIKNPDKSLIPGMTVKIVFKELEKGRGVKNGQNN